MSRPLWTVQVLDPNGRVIFVGAPSNEDEYINIESKKDGPVQLVCAVSDLGALIEKVSIASNAQLAMDVGETSSRVAAMEKHSLIGEVQNLDEPEERMHAKSADDKKRKVREEPQLYEEDEDRE